MISKATEDVRALDYSFKLAVNNLEAQKQAKTSGQKDYEDEEIRTLAPKDRGTLNLDIRIQTLTRRIRPLSHVSNSLVRDLIVN
jgi:hypothetical protein